MTYSISKDLRQVFQLAKLRHEAAKNLTGKEWEEYQKIQNGFAGKRKFEERQYRLEYKPRFEMARKGLINRAAEKNKDFKHRWFSNDRFDKAAINRQAHRLVQNAHHRKISVLDKKEARVIDKFLDNAKHHRIKREKPKRDFMRAADRRQKPERRSENRSQKSESRNQKQAGSKPIKQAPPSRGRSR